MTIRFCFLIFIAITTTSAALADEEISLFTASGNAVAYIAVSDDMTIYLWGGKPVAYLESDSGSDFHVYGFNGKHLGWFINGAIWNHNGDAVCAVEDLIQSPNFEPFKSFK